MSVSNITALVKHQFPAFYREEGGDFIMFLEAYYEWLEQSGMILDETYKLKETTDIDDTADEFLTHFQQKFMASLPAELIGNQRLFQKHILELYRSKGSIAGLKLLFRLLYNENVEVYVPSYDIFKSSDGDFRLPRYVEVGYKPSFWELTGKKVTGSETGATAIVESVHKKIIERLPVYVVYLSSVIGLFDVGEILLTSTDTIQESCVIQGAIKELSVVSSSPQFEIGDILRDSDVNRRSPASFIVKETYSSVGIINFSIVHPGTLYTLDAVCTVSQGSNTSGVGAAVRIHSISNPVEFIKNLDFLAPHANTLLNANAYGLSSNPSANSGTIIGAALDTEVILAGQIAQLTTLNPGTGYDGDVTVTAIDPVTSTRGIITIEGGLSGADGVIYGQSITGTGLISRVEILDSGHAYYENGAILNLEYVPTSNTEFISSSGVFDDDYDLSQLSVVRNKAASYFNHERKFKYALPNKPRINYNPFTGQNLGLMVERAGTNFLLRSNEFEKSPWTTEGGTIELSPNDQNFLGTAFCKMKINAITGTLGLYQSLAAFDAEDGVTVTLLVKPGASGGPTAYTSLNKFSIHRVLPAPESTILSIEVDWATGSFNKISADASSVAELIPMGEGVWMVRLTVKVGLDDNSTFKVYVGAHHAGLYVNDELWIANIQLEQGWEYSSYIPTLSTTQTRPIEVVTIPGVDDPADWTLIIDGIGTSLEFPAVEDLEVDITDIPTGYIKSYSSKLFLPTPASRVMAGETLLTGMGTGEGYFDSTRGFLSADKYLYDGHYYQDFSYVVKSSKLLSRYIDILKAVLHPAGNAVYGITEIAELNPIDPVEVSYTITQS